MTERSCLNCGKPFVPAEGHQQYHDAQCRELAANRRRRARRHYRDRGQVITCRCVTCNVTFTSEDASEHDEDEGCCWYVVDMSDRPCVQCGQPARRGDLFCGDECFARFGNRLIPHDPGKPLSAEDVVWSPYFDQMIEPLLTKIG
jgi:predicted nucleic acid-binding Zn ribbon protein